MRLGFLAIFTIAAIGMTMVAIISRINRGNPIKTIAKGTQQIPIR